MPTSRGLDIQFTLFSFGGSQPGGDGSLLFFATSPHPTTVSNDGGCLGYISKGGYCSGNPYGLTNGYLGIGFDEYGNFSDFLPYGPGNVPETIALGGAVSIGYPYLGGVTDASGAPASLPFDWDKPQFSMRPLVAPRIEVALAPTGTLEVSVDIHDGRGFVTYLSQQIAGVRGQPAVPGSLYVGFIGSNGGNYSCRQISDLRISTLS